MSERTVKIIHPKAELSLTESGSQYPKKRVAAYARVSTDSDEQLSSYEAQVNFYTNHIASNPEWEFVAVYTDEGITGTNTKKREGFNRMVADALNGKIDLILTKSVSRFARNTVDTLTTIRKLKEKGVEVYFEQQNIYTLDGKGEILITIMSSLAQEESRSISENVTWGKKKSMEDGKVSLAYKNFLGYEKGDNGLPKIVEEQAKIVRLIYRLFLEGKTYRTIAERLTEQVIPTPSGKTKWSVSTVSSILSNEKYKGDALLQKTYTVDFLSKTVRKNNGEVQQYYIENSNPAIIDRETFDLVQSEIKKRRPNRRQINNNSPFSAKIICGECGGYYGSKVWHSNSKYRNRLWRCNRKYKNDEHCKTPHIREDELKAAFPKAFCQILCDKEQYIRQFEEVLPLLADTADLQEKLERAQNECDAILGRMRRHMDENARHIQNQDKYEQRFQQMSEQYKEAETVTRRTKEEMLERSARKEKIRRFLGELRKTGDITTEFDENLWSATVESVKVNTDKSLIFLFRDGTEILVPTTNSAE